MAGFFANLSAVFGDFLSSVRDLPAAVKDGHLHMKGRTYLFISGVLVVAVGFSALLAEGVETWKENDRRTGAQMLTSAQAVDADMFDYLIDTAAGRTLAEGELSTEESCVTLPGGEYRGCFASVEEHREDYVTRIEYYECGTEKNPQTCSRTVQEWQGTGTERVEASHANMLGVNLPYGFVRNSLRDAAVSEVREPSDGGFLRNNDHYFYESPTVRYSYNVADNTYYGTVWLDLKAEKQMERIGGFWRGQTIDQVVESHTAEPVAPVVVHWMVQILFILMALTAIAFLVVRDLDDGVDHDF